MSVAAENLGQYRIQEEPSRAARKRDRFFSWLKGTQEGGNGDSTPVNCTRVVALVLIRHAGFASESDESQSRELASLMDITAERDLWERMQDLGGWALDFSTEKSRIIIASTDTLRTRKTADALARMLPEAFPDIPEVIRVAEEVPFISRDDIVPEIGRVFADTREDDILVLAGHNHTPTDLGVAGAPEAQTVRHGEFYVISNFVLPDRQVAA